MIDAWLPRLGSERAAERGLATLRLRAAGRMAIGAASPAASPTPAGQAAADVVGQDLVAPIVRTVGEVAFAGLLVVGAYAGWKFLHRDRR